METITINVQGMSCAHCEKAVTNALTDLGAADIIASANSGTVTFSHDPQALPLANIKTELVDMGYDCE